MKRKSYVIALIIAAQVFGIFLTANCGSAQAEMGPVAAANKQSVGPDNYCWEDQGFNMAGLDGPVCALTQFNGELIAGGSFNVAGNKIARSIASWDGTSWHSLGSGINGTVKALIVWKSLLIAGGQFTIAGDDSASSIAAWDGNSWSPLGSGTESGAVNAMTVFQGDLVVGGYFNYSQNLEEWDGKTWTVLASNVPVFALAEYEDKLVVSGYFNPQHIRAWDGSTWSNLGSGLDKSPSVLATYQGRLVTGAWDWFDSIPAAPYTELAAWDGNNWSAIPSGSGLRHVVALAEWAGKLAVCYERHASSPYSIELWDGSSLSTLHLELHADGLSGGGSTMIEYSGNLVIGGNFYLASGRDADNVIAISADSMLTLSSRQFNPVSALTNYAGQLVVADCRTNPDYSLWGRITTWDGNGWDTLVSGAYGKITAFTTWNGYLVAGGDFTYGAGIEANFIAGWNGSGWIPFGQGVNGKISSVVSYHDQLVTSGDFTEAGGLPANHVASWNGSSWSPLGSGIGSAAMLCVYQDKLVAGGVFSTAGGIEVNAIAFWNGISWSPLGSGLDGGNHDPSVESMIVYNGTLVVGGFFSSAGHVFANNIATWDGSNWSALGEGLEYAESPFLPLGNVTSLSVCGNKLIAGGTFTSAGGLPAENIASWDGTEWSPLGSGTNRQVTALAPYGGKLYVGGDFTSAGDIGSAYLAVWDPNCATDVIEVTEPSLPQRIELRQNYPNPFNPETAIEFALARHAHVTLEVFDLLGRRVVTLVDEHLSPGMKRITWNGRDAMGREVASGVYLYRLKADDFTQSRKMLLLK